MFKTKTISGLLYEVSVETTKKGTFVYKDVVSVKRDTHDYVIRIMGGTTITHPSYEIERIVQMPQTTSAQ